MLAFLAVTSLPGPIDMIFQGSSSLVSLFNPSNDKMQNPLLSPVTNVNSMTSYTFECLMVSEVLSPTSTATFFCRASRTRDSSESLFHIALGPGGTLL